MGVGRILDHWTAKKIGQKGKLTRERLDEYIAAKLEETVLYASERSDFYREKYGDMIGETEDGPRLLREFEDLPFTDSGELRERGMDLLCVNPREISRIVTLDTGGSTGKPKRIYFTEEDQQLTVDYFENGMQLMADRSDKALILMPAKVPGSIGRLLAEGLGNFNAEAVMYGLPEMSLNKKTDDNMEEALKLLTLMEEEKVTGVVALPTHMALLADAADERWKRSSESSGAGLKWVLLSAEYVSERNVNRISEVFGCKVYQHYGMTEMGLGCAVSCGCSEGYHVREADLYLEIINPETGKPVKKGERGEIVFTTLTRAGMPFIRYRTGDYSKWIEEECPCGSVLKRLDKVEPRNVVKGYLRR